MDWRELTALDELGFSSFDKKALVILTTLGVADAATICREGDIPTSKIYHSMEKLADLGLVEIQPTRPKLYLALTAEEVVERLVEISHQRAEAFSAQSHRLRRAFSSVQGRLRSRRTFVDLALGIDGHVKRHLMQLTTAKQTILSYVEDSDLSALSRIKASGFDVLRRVAQNVAEHQIDHRMIFGFTNQTASRMLTFLRQNAASLAHLRGVRYCGEMGHPFHIVDHDKVILALDHPFVEERRCASLLVQDKDLARSLTEGFEKLWSKALADLREIRFHPGT